MVSRLLPHQDLEQLGIGAVLGDAAHVVEELVLGVGAEIGDGDLVLGEVGHQRLQVLDAVVDAAEGAGREAAVAAVLALRRALQHQHGDAVLGGGEGGAQRGIARADDHDIGGCRKHAGRTPRWFAGGQPIPCARRSQSANRPHLGRGGVAAAALPRFRRGRMRGCSVLLLRFTALRRETLMYARVTTFKVDPARVGEVAGKFKEMGPAAEALPGVVDVYAAWRADGQGSVTAIYNSKADADAAAAKIKELWGGLTSLLKSGPNTEAYDSVEHMVG